MYNYCTNKPYPFMTTDAIPIDTMVFRKNFTESPYKK